jgi:YebC/PmpR family DNA-binding regulatory protein
VESKRQGTGANAKGKLFGRLSKDIMVAARSGADPSSNSRLRLVVEQARKVSMPKDTLERAIKKGAGLTGEAVHFEHVMYEGFAPHRVAVMVECLTDNVNRTAPEMRVLFRKGQLGTSGSVAWDFDHVGMIEAEPTAPGADPEVAAIEAGAQDLEPGEDGGPAVPDRPHRPGPGQPRTARPWLQRAVRPSWATSPRTRSTQPA